MILRYMKTTAIPWYPRGLVPGPPADTKVHRSSSPYVTWNRTMHRVGPQHPQIAVFDLLLLESRDSKPMAVKGCLYSY